MHFSLFHLLSQVFVRAFIVLFVCFPSLWQLPLFHLEVISYLSLMVLFYIYTLILITIMVLNIINQIMHILMQCYVRTLLVYHIVKVFLCELLNVMFYSLFLLLFLLVF